MSKIVKSIYTGGTITALGEMTTTDTIDGVIAPLVSTLTDAATITPDFTVGCNFTVTLGGNRTMGNPSTMPIGQSGSIFINQDATGGRTMAWSSYWDFPNGIAPTLSVNASSNDRVDYIVRSSTSIQAVFTGSYA